MYRNNQFLRALEGDATNLSDPTRQTHQNQSVALPEASCDTCKNRQRGLDPEGCFMQVSTTGWFGRLCVKIFGCYRYRNT